MINKIPDFNIRETNLEEPEAQEPQAQDKMSSEAEPLVQATPEYKAGLITERRLASQAQEMLLRNQLVIDLDEKPLSEKSVPEIYKEAFQEIPKRLGDTAKEVEKAWSDPGKTFDQVKKDVEQKWSDIKAGNSVDVSSAGQNETRQPVSFTRDDAPRETPKSGSQIIQETIQNIPQELDRQVGEIGKAWSDPGQVISDAAENASRLWSDIKEGK